MALQDMKELFEMISDIKTKAEASKVYKDKCVALADYTDNLTDSFHLLQSSRAFLGDPDVQRSLAALKIALQKTVVFMESCGNALTASTVFSKGPVAVKELKEEIQEGLSLLSLALNVHNARKAGQPLEPTLPHENGSDSPSNTSAVQNVSVGLPSRESLQKAEARDSFGESLQKTEAWDPFGRSSQKAEDWNPFGKSSQKTEAWNPFSKSSEKETAGPSAPSGSSKNVVAESPHAHGETSQNGMAGSDVSGEKVKYVEVEPSREIGESSQAAGAGSSYEIFGESTESALADPSGALAESSRSLSVTPCLILGSHSVVSTSLSASTPHAHRIPATSFSVCWSNVPSYWVTTSCNGSTYDEVLYLRNVCWLDAKVQVDTGTLKPGTYTLTWRYKVQCLDDCWEHTPVTFKMSDAQGQTLLERRMYLCPKVAVRYNEDLTVTASSDREEPVPLCSKDAPSESEGIWIEYPVFNFTVEEGEKEQLEFTLMEHSDSFWKHGLVLDAVFITPRL